MKKIIIFIFIILLGLGFYSCEKELKSENVSTGLANYPNIIMEGDQYLTIVVGQTYTDKGAKAYSGVSDITSSMTVDGTVDSNTPGVYLITYSVTNDEDRSFSISRYVGVITSAAANGDISGTYLRSLPPADPARVVEIKKLDYPGLYENDNPGGLRPSVAGDQPYIVSVRMFQTEESVISVPPQPTALGTFACINGSYNSADSSFSYKVDNLYYGAATRTFVKQ